MKWTRQSAFFESVIWWIDRLFTLEGIPLRVSDLPGLERVVTKWKEGRVTVVFQNGEDFRTELYLSFVQIFAQEVRRGKFIEADFVLTTELGLECLQARGRFFDNLVEGIYTDEELLLVNLQFLWPSLAEELPGFHRVREIANTNAVLEFSWGHLSPTSRASTEARLLRLGEVVEKTPLTPRGTLSLSYRIPLRVY